MTMWMMVLALSVSFASQRVIAQDRTGEPKQGGGVKVTETSYSDIRKRQLSLADGHQTVVPVHSLNEVKKGVSLAISFEDRAYLLGEPILIRCSLINNTPSSIAIPYECGSSSREGSFVVDIRSEKGVLIERINVAPLCNGGISPQSVQIPSGHRFVHTINLAWTHAIGRAGTYDISVQYRSKGKAHDAADVRRETKLVWAGVLDHHVGRLVVQVPSTESDKAALSELLQHYSKTSTGSDPRYRYVFPLYLVRADQKDQIAFIERHSKSRYADFCRLHLVSTDLRRFSYPTPKSIAQESNKHLRAISLNSQSMLIREWVEAHVIDTEVPMGHKPEDLGILVRQFREKFPDSPISLPELSRPNR